MTTAADPIPVTCPHCARFFKVKPEGAGKTVRCPGCKAQVTVPGASSYEGGLGDWHLSEMSSAPPPDWGQSATATRQQSSPSPIQYTVPESRTYGAVAALGFTFRAIGALGVGLGIGAVILGVFLSIVLESPVAWLLLLPAAVTSALLGFLFMGFGELLSVAVDIQDNTLVSARAAEIMVANAGTHRE